MEDYEAQEVEFWAKLEEEGMSRSSMLRRSVAAAAGLTVMGSASTALGMSKMRAAAPAHMTQGAFKQLVTAAKKEGHLNTIALPPDWANYKEALATFPKKYGIGITNDNPDGSSAQENQAIVSLKGDSRAPDVVDVGESFAITGANTGLYAPVLQPELQHDPAGAQEHPRLLDGRLLGCRLDRLQQDARLEPAEDVQGPAQARVQGQGRDQRQPALVELGHRGRDRLGARERRLGLRRRPRHRLLGADEEERQLHPGRDDLADGRVRARRRSRSTGTTTTTRT